MIILQSILHTFKLSIIFRGSSGRCENWLEQRLGPITKPPWENKANMLLHVIVKRLIGKNGNPKTYLWLYHWLLNDYFVWHLKAFQTELEQEFRRSGMDLVQIFRFEELSIPLGQRCPTYLPLATCDELPFTCGEWLCFLIQS